MWLTDRMCREFREWSEALDQAAGDWRLRLVYADWCEERGYPHEYWRMRAAQIQSEQRERALAQWKVTVCGFIPYSRPPDSAWYNQVTLLSPGQEESLTLREGFSSIGVLSGCGRLVDGDGPS